MTLKELQSPKTERMKVDQSTIYRLLCNTSLYEGHKRSHYSKRSVRKHLQSLPESITVTQLHCGKRYCAQMRPGQSLFQPQIQSYMCSATAMLPTQKNSIRTVKYGAVSILLWGDFSSAGTGHLVKVEGRMDGANFMELLHENQCQNLSVGYTRGQINTGVATAYSFVNALGDVQHCSETAKQTSLEVRQNGTCVLCKCNAYPKNCH